MKRERLVRKGVLTVTPDTAEALEKIAREAGKQGFKIDFQRPVPMEGVPRQLSMVEAGRCVSMRAVFGSEVPDAIGLAKLWGVAVPLHFTPWDRNPVPSPTDQVFHFLGPWETLYQRLIASGRGEHAWASTCVAAQCDVGVWEGNRELERFVQAQLHRIGQNPGPIDGQIGPQTVAAIHALGLKDVRDLTLLAKELESRPTGVISSANRVYGHVVVPGRDLSVSTFGKIKSTKTKNGVALTIDGPGRVVVDIGG